MRPNLTLVASAFLVCTSILACSKDHPTDEGGMLAPSATATASTAPTASAAAADSAATAMSASAAASAGAAPADAASPTAANSAAAVTCGSKTNPCPLQKWMKDHTQMDLSAGDLPSLAGDMDKIAAMAPAGYTKWASMAKDGATAARAGNNDAVKASCRGCHDAYKTKYKTEMRTRPVT